MNTINDALIAAREFINDVHYGEWAGSGGRRNEVQAKLTKALAAPSQPAAAAPGTWFFEANLPTETLLAIEPDGTPHVVKNGNMQSVAGLNLLNRMMAALSASHSAPQAGAVLTDGQELWLWRNGDHMLAFQHLYPCFTPGGDPMTLGEPTGRAVFRLSQARARSV